MKRFSFAVFLLSLTAGHDASADISGYTLIRPALDAEIHPRLVAAAANGNVWFAQQIKVPHSIGFFTKSGHVTNFPLPCTRCASGEEVIYVCDLAAAPDGSVWFIDNHAMADGTSIDSAIGHLTTSGVFTFFAIPTRNATAIVPGGFGHSSLALAPDGTVWFTENAAFRAARLSGGSFAEYPLEMPEQPAGITIGNDGKIWYAVTDREIAMITPPTNGEFVEFSLAGGSYPFDLATGSDGNIWATEAGRHKIARIKPSGLISEFQLPTSNGGPQHIVAAPDGTLWYTESTGMDVGRITLNEPAAPVFEAIATPGQQNFDVTATTASPGGPTVVYFTGQDTLSMLVPTKCVNSPSVSGPHELTATRQFHGVFTIGGRDPLNVTIEDLPASWSAQLGPVTVVDSGASPDVGNYAFTISVVDGEGCSISERITVTIVDVRRRAARH